MKITKKQLRKLINEYHPRPDDDYDPLDPDDDEDDAAYDQGYDDGFNGYPSKPVTGGDYHAGYEEGVNDAKDEEVEQGIEGRALHRRLSGMED